MIRQCPKCHRTFEDQSLNFCLEDGTPLKDAMTIHDLQAETLRLDHGYDTKAIPEPRKVGLQIVVQSEAGKMESFREDEWAGTKRLSRGLEGFSLRIIPTIPELSLRYKGHFRETGDTDFVNEGVFLRSPNEGRCLEGFTIELIGKAAKQYQIFYSAHIQAWNDSREYRGGEFCGSRDRKLRIEAIKVRLAYR